MPGLERSCESVMCAAVAVLAVCGLSGLASAQPVPTAEAAPSIAIAVAVESDGPLSATEVRTLLATQTSRAVVPLGQPANMWLAVRVTGTAAVVFMAVNLERWELRLTPPTEGAADAAWLAERLATVIAHYEERSTLRNWQGHPLTRRTAALLPWPAREGEPTAGPLLATRTLLPWPAGHDRPTTGQVEFAGTGNAETGARLATPPHR